MEEQKGRQEYYSESVRAGKRTYFFDVKSTKSNDFYITVTESKRRWNNEDGRFYYEKHKLFLYKEDFDKFSKALQSAIDFIKSEQEVVEKEHTTKSSFEDFSQVSFEDLGDKEDKESKE
jgi:hypothetical protein